MPPFTAAELITFVGVVLAFIVSLVGLFVNKAQNSKLQRIEMVVNGRYTDVLQQVIDLKKLLAEKIK